ncbi:hypothetical protein K443DRAFT_125603 [Laccaria amethystina LaAM-08-1]|uniref:Uncharacterized protein n=1 Tax=Laccaria amethystina LaAM-08-1 TaxID=1095629 RepID=A0A0C9WX71_9AGAR|nr:hypothetical protein K443DRAFT_125603 [Laccaria amethystina LaAM-08-1]
MAGATARDTLNLMPPWERNHAHASQLERESTSATLNAPPANATMPTPASWNLERKRDHVHVSHTKLDPGREGERGGEEEGEVGSRRVGSPFRRLVSTAMRVLLAV